MSIINDDARIIALAIEKIRKCSGVVLLQHFTTEVWKLNN